MKVLITTHSSRFFDSSRANLNSLNIRFDARSFDNLPDIGSFGPWNEAIALQGKIAFWRIDYNCEKRVSAKLLACIEPAFNPQSACFVGDVFLVAGPDRIMRFGPGFESLDPIVDNWIAGTHTVRKARDDTIWVTSAPANAVLRIDPMSGSVLERVVMPARYGAGYQVTPDDNLRKHFIPLEYQPTHINSAWPIGDEVLVTLFVPGAVGLFDKERSYREIFSGLRGCHGARLHPQTGHIYVTDSPGGFVWYIERESGRVLKRLDFHSRWLHDAELLDKGVLLGMVSDQNMLHFMDEATGECLETIKCDGLGRSALFSQVAEVPQSWVDTLSPRDGEETSAEARFEMHEDLMPLLLDKSNLAWRQGHIRPLFEVQDKGPKRYEYIMVAAKQLINRGTYRLSCNVQCFEGGVTVGLVDARTGDWIAQCQCDAYRSEDWVDFTHGRSGYVSLVVAACNVKEIGPVHALVESIQLSKHAV